MGLLMRITRKIGKRKDRLALLKRISDLEFLKGVFDSYPLSYFNLDSVGEVLKELKELKKKAGV